MCLALSTLEKNTISALRSSGRPRSGGKKKTSENVCSSQFTPVSSMAEIGLCMWQKCGWGKDSADGAQGGQCIYLRYLHGPL